MITPSNTRALSTDERGAPQVGVEIISPPDARELPWAKRFERYRQAGIAEVVRFSVLGETPVLTLWDLVERDLVERDLGDPEAFFSDALGYYWCIVPGARASHVRVKRSTHRPSGVVTSERRLVR